MELTLLRTYGENGVNGILYLHDQQICYTLELPWKNNQRQISCIPEGSYLLRKRYSLRFEWHLHLQHVPGRSMILIHPANHAMKELQGCIAPVSIITGEGTGLGSVKAMQRLLAITDSAMRADKSCLLKIGSTSLP